MMSASESLGEVTVPPPRKRGWLIFWSAVLICIGMAAGSYYYTAWKAAARLEAALAATERADPNWRLEDLEAHREVIPDDQNSALVAAAAAQLVPSGGYSPLNKVMQELNLNTANQLNPEQVRLLREGLTEASRALTMARKLKYMPKGRYVINWAYDGIGTLLPHLQPTRELANLLACDALLRAQDKDMDGALESCRATLNVARSVGDEPTYISALVRVAIRAVALNKLERTLGQGEPSEAALAATQKAWEEEMQYPIWVAAARGERALGDRCIVALQKGGLSALALAGLGGSSGLGTGNATLDRFIIPFQIGSLTTNRAAFLELHNEVIEIGKLPERECKARFEQMKARRNQLPILARLLFPASEKVTAAFVRSQAQMRTMIAALAAERYRKANGRWPDSLSVLVPTYLKEVPADPFDGAPLRFRRLPDGLVIYSIGPDEVDNGGTLGNGVTPGTDVGVRLWDVAHRRQAPLPSEPATP